MIILLTREAFNDAGDPLAEQYDVCIIGSGAGGGTAAKVLTEGGLSVVMIEAGPPLNPRGISKSMFGPTSWPIAEQA